MPALSRTLSVMIARDPRDVYDFASNPENLPRWITSFAKTVKNIDGRWMVETSAGPMEFIFVDRNDAGILDHRVRLPSGKEIFNPMRVLRHGSGSEVTFTLVQSGGMSAEQFETDAGMVQRDLDTLKKALETPSI
jgi:uncharacterized protein YndB with AHSA1/START domain